MKAKKLFIITSFLVGMSSFQSFAITKPSHLSTYDSTNPITLFSNAELFASSSKHYYEDVQTTIPTPYGNVTIKCRLGGNFTYDLNSGKITATYGESMSQIEFVPPDLGDGRNPNFWHLEVQNLTFSTGISGDKVTTTARFKISGVYLTNGAVETNDKFSVDGTLKASGYVG